MTLDRWCLLALALCQCLTCLYLVAVAIRVTILQCVMRNQAEALHWLLDECRVAPTVVRDDRVPGGPPAPREAA